MAELKSKHPLTGALASLVVLAASLLLVGAAGSGPSLADSSTAAPGPDVHQPTATQATTTTLFLPFIVRPETAPAHVWLGEYYANTSLSGDPAYTTEETRIDHDWGDGGAPAGLPADHFSIRWTGEWDLDIGEYTFFVYADDGVRLWLDGELLIDHWSPGLGSHRATTTVQSAGRHTLKLEYFEETGGAAISLRFRRTDLFPTWHGDYYSEPWVEYGWLYERTDDVIQFDWGEGCPANLPCDAFSVDWDATPTFLTGTHRLYLYADEGYQLFVDGNKVMEGGWYDGQGGGSQDASYDLTVNSAQQHEILYNFHDRGTLAEARLWIVDLSQPKWTAEYFANMELSGTPETTKQEAAVFADWKLGKPYPILPSADTFSARWTGQLHFYTGCYRFGLFADDGVRLWVDGELLVDEWHLGRGTYHSPITCLAPGQHDVVIEYFENAGDAEIRFWWE